jgi:integrase
VLNPHAFRHLAAKLILDAEPGAYGKARLVLNHASTAMVERVYGGSEKASAVRHFDKHILEKRGPWEPDKAPRARQSNSDKGKRDAA